MRIVLTMILIVCAAAAGDLSGGWQGPTDMKDRDGNALVFHMKLQQDGAKLSGGVWTDDHDEDQPRPIQRGTVDGNHVRFEVPQKADAVVTFELETDGETLTGWAKFQGPNGPQQIKLSLKRVPSR